MVTTSLAGGAPAIPLYNPRLLRFSGGSNMSSNTIRARVAFSFRGESHDLDATFDLDRCQAEAGEVPNFHLLLARASGIDPYSYLYEVLESHDIEFSQPTGAARGCCLEGGLDWFCFLRERRDAADLSVLRGIAQECLGLTDLETRPEIKAALLAAFRAGQGSAPK